MSKRVDIQGLRGIAVLAVLADHAGLPIKGGFTGVDVFFVVSGYVIFGSIIRQIDLAGGSFNLAQFIGRRFRRLFPPLGVVVAFSCIASIGLAPVFDTQGQIAKTAFGSLLGIGNLAIARTTGDYFDAPASLNPLLHVWSLGVEEQFYLGLGLVILAITALKKSTPVMRILPTLAAGGLLLSWVFTILVAHTDLGAITPVWATNYYSPVVRVWEFLVGVLLAICVSLTRPRISESTSRICLVVSIALIGISFLVISGQSSFPNAWAVLPVAGTAGAIWSGSVGGLATQRILGNYVFRSIGDMSYSIYLWHWPFVSISYMVFPSSSFSPLVFTLFSLIPAVAAYRLIENSAILVSREKSRGLKAPVIVGTVLPFMCATLLSVGSHFAWGVNWATTSASDKLTVQSGCVDTQISLSRCTWYPQQDGPTPEVVLLGDSSAFSVSEGLISAAEELQLSVFISSQSGCPFLSLKTTRTHALDCSKWQSDSLQLSVRPDVQTVVIANRSSGYLNVDLGWRTFIDSDGLVATSETAAQLYEESLSEVVAFLRSHGKQVVIVGSLAEPELIRRNDSFVSRIFRGDSSLGFTMRSAETSRNTASEIERKIAYEFAATYIDPMKSLCNSGWCPFWNDLGDLYLDTFHLTALGAMQLRDQFVEALSDRKGI